MIDDAIDRLAGVLADVGMPEMRPPGPAIEQTLQDIERAIAPLRLPDDLVTFWRRVDPQSLAAMPYPELCTASFALDTWRNHLDVLSGMVPRLLFPMAYQSWSHLLIELASGDEPGGAIFAADYGGLDTFTLRFPSLTAYLDLLATMLDLGEVERHSTEARVWYTFDPHHEWEETATVRLAMAMPVGRYTSTTVPGDVRAWPEHWLAADGITEQSRAPRGATTTVAALLDLAARGHEAKGTVQGLITRLSGSGSGVWATIDDGTGGLDLFCAPSETGYQPVMRRRFEIDVEVPAHPADNGGIETAAADVQAAAARGDVAAMQEAAAGLGAAMDPTAALPRATAVRPLD